MSLRRVVAPLLVLLVAACTDPEPEQQPQPLPDSGVVDAGTSDSGTPGDGGTSDSGVADAGTSDSGTPGDAGPSDSGVPDAGPSDSGVPDAGLPDSGTPGDAGTTDGGTQTPVRFVTAVLPDGYVSRTYSAQLSAADGVHPYTWRLHAGSLPAGVALTPDGALSGTPGAAGIYTLTITVEDASGQTASGGLALNVYTVPTVSDGTPLVAYVGDSVSLSLTSSGGKAPMRYSARGLPQWLTLSQEGQFQGVPQQAGTFSFEVDVADSNAVSTSRTMSFTVRTLPVVSTSALPRGTVGRTYQTPLAATGGQAPMTWSFRGALPSGLSLSSEGVLSGTPNSAGESTFTVTVRDAGGKTAERSLSLRVVNPTAPLFTVGQWNIAYFGHDSLGPIHSTSSGGSPDDLQISYARQVIADAGANLWGLVEMVDPSDFAAMKAQIPGAQGFLANDPLYVPGGATWYSDSEQKVGLLYDSTLTFVSARVILTEQDADFSGRPPLRADFTTRIQGVETPLVVIVVHMKANADSPSRDTRARASAALKAYLDQFLPTEHVFVLGDWNDDVDKSIVLDGTNTPLPTPYANFVEDPDRYTFITRPLSLAGGRSTVEFDDVVDHTLASNEAARWYESNSARILAPDEWIPDYLNTVTDHYPVVSAYAFTHYSEVWPTLRLKTPHGGTYQSGSVVAITWTSWDVENVRIEYSNNEGDSWNVIAPSVPAAESRYLWTAPSNERNPVLVRVVDAKEPTLKDESDWFLTFVSTPARVFINEYLATEPIPVGSTQGNPDYEFVELVNASPFPVDLTGWSIKDNTTTIRHVFPAGATVGPGQAFVVYGGSSAVPPGAVRTMSASSKSLGLNNASDTIFLRFPDGGTADQVTYTTSTRNVSDNRSPDGNPDAGFVLHNVLNPGLTSSPGLRADGGSF